MGKNVQGWNCVTIAQRNARAPQGSGSEYCVCVRETKKRRRERWEVSHYFKRCRRRGFISLLSPIAWLRTLKHTHKCTQIQCVGQVSVQVLSAPVTRQNPFQHLPWPCWVFPLHSDILVLMYVLAWESVSSCE